MQRKHENYEILNLIGYGLAKFDTDFVKNFGYTTKTAFFDYIVQIGIAGTVGTVKNRQDLFDPFFENKRKGWWQKGNTYIHRKVYIDSLFGSLEVNAYTNIVKLYLQDTVLDVKTSEEISPIIKSKFKQLQETGQEAELFFMRNFNNIDHFENGILEDARTFGDGYDFQVEVRGHFYLAEIKGIRTDYGSVRLTQNEFDKAKELDIDYALVVVYNLNDLPLMNVVFDPVQSLNFTQNILNVKQYNYHSKSISWAK